MGTINIEGKDIEKSYVRDILVEHSIFRWQHIEASKLSKPNGNH